MTEYYDKLCKCGCGRRIEIKSHHKRRGVPDYVWGHNDRIYNSKKKFDEIEIIDKALKVGFYDRLCRCGCGQKISVDKSHKYNGIPVYIKDHSFKDKESREICRNRMLGSHPSKETLIKRSISLKKVKRTDEWCNNISMALTNKKLSKEHIKSIIESHKGKTWEKMFGKEKSELMRLERSIKYKGINAPNYGRKFSEEVKRRMSESRKIVVANPEYIKKVRKARLKQVIPYRDTSIEVKMQKELKRRGIDFKTHYPIIGQPDIFIEPNITIFCDGDYWHCYPTGKPRDWYVNELLSDMNYNVFRFWESDIKECVNWCVNRIEAFINNRRIMESAS